MFQAGMARGFSAKDTPNFLGSIAAKAMDSCKVRKEKEQNGFYFPDLFLTMKQELLFFIVTSWFQGNSNIALRYFFPPYIYWFLWRELMINCCLYEVVFCSTLSSTSLQEQMNRYVVDRELTWFVLLRSYFGKWEVCIFHLLNL